MPRRNKNSVSVLIDSFIASVNRTGGGSSWSIALIFLIGGMFSLYVGYTSPSLVLMFGGGVAILIGFMLSYKTWHAQTTKKRRRNSRA
jgi:hypothetical protein